MTRDPTVTDPTLYRTIFENDRVRVLEYHDHPGDVTTPHAHPDSVMITMSAFGRRVSSGGRQVDLAFDAGEVRWLGAQEHVGENTGSTETRVLFVELKEPASTTVDDALGPNEGQTLQPGWRPR